MTKGQHPEPNAWDYQRGQVQGVILAKVEGVESKIERMTLEFGNSHERLSEEIHSLDKKLEGLRGRVFGIAGGISAIVAVLGLVAALIAQATR